MNRQLRWRVSALLAAAAWCCDLRAQAAPVPVADANDLYFKMATWLPGTDLDLELPPGTYDISDVAIRNAVGTPVNWLLIGIFPGNLRITGVPALGSNLAAFPNDVTVIARIPFQPANGKGLSLNCLRFKGAIDPGVRTVAISMDRVWLAGPQPPLTLSPNCSLTMTSCTVQGVGITTAGAVTINRCTFDTPLSVAGTTGSINSSIFQTGISVDANFAGTLNYLQAGGTPLGATAFKPGFSVPILVPVPPDYIPQVSDPHWWPGMVSFAVMPANPSVVASTPPPLDFEGQVIDGRPQIGADQQNGSIPPPSWSDTTITGTAGETLYRDAGNLVPFIGKGRRANIHIVTYGIITPYMETQDPTGLFVVIVPQDTAVPTITIPVAQADITYAGTDLTRAATIDTYYAANDDPSYDGLAQVELLVGTASRTAMDVNEDPLKRSFIIDTLPPLLPPGFGDAVPYDLVTSAIDPGVVACGGWLRDTDLTTSVGTVPQYLFNSDTTLDFTLTVPLEDAVNLAGAANSGFLAPGALLDRTEPTVDLSTAVVDPLLGKVTLGTASWKTDTVRAVTTAITATGYIANPPALATGAAAATNFSVTGLVQPPTITTPEVFKWDATIVLTDRAGNFRELGLPIRFWWMPPGSTWATVTGDNKDPLAPSFSWDLALNGSAGNVKDFADCGFRPQAQLLVCGQVGNQTALELPGWESVGGMDWTDWSTESSVGPNTLVGRGTNTVVLGDLFRGLLGQNLIVVVRASDPAGNEQIDIGGLEAPSLASGLRLDQLEALNIHFGGVYTIPSLPPAGGLDTTVSAKFFLNRTDRDSASLWQIDGDETTFGSGPNVPLTPLNACSQRLEAEFTVTAGTADVTDPSKVVGAEFLLYENGTLVAHGNLQPENNGDTMKLYVPTDLMNIARGAGGRNPFNGVFVSNQGNADTPEETVDDFLAELPKVCKEVVGAGEMGLLGQDRLGDDGEIAKPGEKEPNGVLKVGHRARAVNYTLVVLSTTDPRSSYDDPKTNELYDATPATFRFTVIPDQKPDSDNPRVKTNNPLSYEMPSGPAPAPEIVQAKEDGGRYARFDSKAGAKDTVDNPRVKIDQRF